MTRMMCFTTTLLMTFSARAVLHAQGTLADYQRAHDLQAKVRDLVIHSPGPMSWIGDTHHFWYAHTVKGGAEYMLVNADAGEKKLAFDHAKLARPVAQEVRQARNLCRSRTAPLVRVATEQNSLRLPKLPCADSCRSPL
ncbi:MAG TPA: hypothetical protein VFB43_15260 [Terracidiphilus sp.]|nr:hypothetical protein [Terracidiphilus sp.]